MTAIFVACAALGGTILVCQTLLMLFGIGAESLHGDFGGDFHGDLGGGHDAGGHAGGHAGIHSGDEQQDDDHAAADSHHVAWLFSVLSFRTIVAALTFFGLAGLAARVCGRFHPHRAPGGCGRRVGRPLWRLLPDADIVLAAL